MSTTVNTGWLKDDNGEKFAPKTLASQVITNDGVSIESAINEIEELQDAVSVLENSTPAVGSGVTIAQTNSLWAIIQKSSFAEILTDDELTAFKNAWGIEDSSGSGDDNTGDGGTTEPDIPETGVSNETTWTDGVAYTGLTWEEDKYLHASNGNVSTDEGWGLTQYLYCEGASRLHITNTYRRSGNYSGFFDADKKWISSFCGTPTTLPQGSTTIGVADVTVPENAVYFRLSTDMTGVVTITPYA